MPNPSTVTAEVLEPETPEPVEKFPTLRKLQTALQEERAQIIAASATLRAQRDSLVGIIQPYELELQSVNRQIKAIELPRLAEIDNELGAIARALGGRSMSKG